MTEFGDWANVDVEKLLRASEEHAQKATDLSERMTELRGHAASEDGRVEAHYAAAGLTELKLDPRAMRMGSELLAEEIVKTVQAAALDMQRQMQEAMAEMFGEEDNPMKLLSDPEAVKNKVESLQRDYNKTLDSVMAEMDKHRRRLGL